MFATLTKLYQPAFVPFFLDKVALDPSLMQSDGIHPNAKGQPQLLENLWPKLRPLLVAPGKPAG
jgi:acyl-CoA thioesterase-1